MGFFLFLAGLLGFIEEETNGDEESIKKSHRTMKIAAVAVIGAVIIVLGLNALGLIPT